jgi:hypothetical protein
LREPLERRGDKIANPITHLEKVVPSIKEGCALSEEEFLPMRQANTQSGVLLAIEIRPVLLSVNESSLDSSSVQKARELEYSLFFSTLHKSP